MWKRPVVHPYLFGIFPILFLYAQNANETYLSEVLKPTLIVVVAAVGLMVLLYGILRSATKSGLIVSSLVLLFFSFGHTVALFHGQPVPVNGWKVKPEELVLFFWGLIFLSTTVLTVATRRKLTKLTSLLNVVAIALVSVQLIQAGSVVVTRDVTAPGQTQVLSRGDARPVLPDIYYIIMDGYGRQDVLQEIYDYDNSSFLDHIEEQGFFIARESHSNYCQTLLALASSLNLDYVEQLLELDPASKDRMPLVKLLKENLVFRTLREHGYTIAAFATGYGLTEIKEADCYLKSDRAVSDFQDLLINTTPLKLFFERERSSFDIHRDRVRATLEKLPNTDEVPSPFFVIAHVVSPHPPYVFGENGESVARTWHPYTFADGSHFIQSGGTKEQYLIGYRYQIEYVTTLLQATIDAILARSSDTPPIIVLQSDHGPGSGLVWKSAEETDVKERFSILNAHFLPGIEGNPGYDSISSVNTFRIIFNEYFGGNYEILPDRSYFSTGLAPYKFEDVTARLAE